MVVLEFLRCVVVNRPDFPGGVGGMPISFASTVFSMSACNNLRGIEKIFMKVSIPAFNWSCYITAILFSLTKITDILLEEPRAALHERRTKQTKYSSERKKIK